MFNRLLAAFCDLGLRSHLASARLPCRGAASWSNRTDCLTHWCGFRLQDPDPPAHLYFACYLQAGRCLRSSTFVVCLRPPAIDCKVLQSCGYGVTGCSVSQCSATFFGFLWLLSVYRWMFRTR